MKIVGNNSPTSCTPESSTHYAPLQSYRWSKKNCVCHGLAKSESIIGQSFLCHLYISKECSSFVYEFYNTIQHYDYKVFFMVHINCSVSLCSLVNCPKLSARFCPVAKKLNSLFNLAPQICEIIREFKHKSCWVLEDLFWL